MRTGSAAAESNCVPQPHIAQWTHTHKHKRGRVPRNFCNRQRKKKNKRNVHQPSMLIRAITAAVEKPTTKNVAQKCILWHQAQFRSLACYYNFQLVLANTPLPNGQGKCFAMCMCVCVWYGCAMQFIFARFTFVYCCAECRVCVRRFARFGKGVQFIVLFFYYFGADKQQQKMHLWRTVVGAPGCAWLPRTTVRPALS